MNPPFISVCIPVYNGASTIREAVESVLQQNYPNFELNVCENVSTDNTASILREIQQKGDPRVNVLYHTDHVPLAANLNRAARMSRAPYLIVLSADDLLKQGALEVFNRQIQRYPDAEVFIGRASYIIEKGGRPLERSIYHHQPGPVANFENFTVANSFPVNINAMLLKAELAFFNEHCGVVTDLDMMIRFGIEKRKVVLVDEELIYYRIHEGATSANRIRMFRESLAVYQNYLSHTTQPALYRKRIFRTLFWCSTLLIDADESESAKKIVADFNHLLGFRDRCILALTLRIPWKISMLEAIRRMRGRWIGAR